MKPLERAQALLERALRSREPTAGEDWLELEQLIAAGPGLSAREQAEIYREQYWLRHRDCLLEDYPALHQLLGDEGFDDFARAYLDAHPPTSFTLRDLGNHLPDFAASWDGFATSVACPARDAARYELAFVDLFDGADREPLTLDEVAAVPADLWPSTRLLLHPLLTLLPLQHPVDELRRALREAAEPPPQLPARPLWLAMWRGADRVIREERLTETEYGVLSSLASGMPLGAALERVAASLPAERQGSLGDDVGRWFRCWATRGWIVALETGAG